MTTHRIIILLLIIYDFCPTRMSEPESSDLTVKSLQNILEKAQAEADSTSSPWQKNIIKQSESVYQYLQQLLSILNLSRIQFLFQTMEDSSGVSDFVLNRWLRLIIGMSSNSTESSNPNSKDLVETDLLTSKIIELFSQLRNHVIEAIKLFKEFNNISSKLNKLHRTYKKYTFSLMENPASVIPITEVILSKHIQDEPEIPVTSNPSLYVLTVIKQKILLEYVDDKSQVFKMILPTMERCDDILMLKAIINNFDFLISTSKDDILSTAKSIRKMSPDIQDSMASLISVLEKHNRKARIRPSVCSLDTRRRLAMIESAFQTLSKVLSDISINLKRVVGISEYLSTVLSPQNCTSLRDIQSHSRIWWTFNQNKVRRFREDVQLEAEEFMKAVRDVEKKSECTFRLHLPVAPELTSIIVKRALTSVIDAAECPEFLLQEDAGSSNLHFSTKYRDHNNVDTMCSLRDDNDLEDKMERLRFHNETMADESNNSDDYKQKDPDDYQNSDIQKPS